MSTARPWFASSRDRRCRRSSETPLPSSRERWLEEYVTACRIRDYIIPVKWPLEVLRFHFLLDPNPDPGPESEHLYSLCTWIGLTWILILHCLPDSTWAYGKLAEAAGSGNIHLKVNPTQVHDQMGHPVEVNGKYVG